MKEGKVSQHIFVQQVVDHVGGAVVLSDLIGCSFSVVYNWLNQKTTPKPIMVERMKLLLTKPNVLDEKSYVREPRQKISPLTHTPYFYKSRLHKIRVELQRVLQETREARTVKSVQVLLESIDQVVD
jgi:hypothetical protein